MYSAEARQEYYSFGGRLHMGFRCKFRIVMQLGSHILDLQSLILSSPLSDNILSCPKMHRWKRYQWQHRLKQSSLECVGWILHGFSNDVLYIQDQSSREHKIKNSATVHNFDSFETCQLTHCEWWKWSEHSQLHCRKGGRDRRLHSNEISPSSYHSSHHTRYTP